MSQRSHGNIPCTGRLEYLAHWTSLGSLVDGTMSEAHDGEEEGRDQEGVKKGRNRLLPQMKHV